MVREGGGRVEEEAEETLRLLAYREEEEMTSA